MALEIDRFAAKTQGSKRRTWCEELSKPGRTRLEGFEDLLAGAVEVLHLSLVHLKHLGAERWGKKR